MWISFVYKKDIHHDAAKAIVQWIDAQAEYSIVITNLILAEISNFLHRKSIAETGLNFVEAILNSEKIDLFYDSEQYLAGTIEIYKRIEQLGYVDSNIVLFYKLLKYKCLISFDSNYDGIKVPLTL